VIGLNKHEIKLQDFETINFEDKMEEFRDK
jgi:hypothetical protein